MRFECTTGVVGWRGTRGGDYTTWGVWDYYHEQWVEESLPLREAERLARHMNNLSNPSEE